MKIRNNNLILMLSIFIVCFIVYPSNVKAVLQSNGGTPTTKDIGTWLLQIRQMEQLGGTLGLSDTINTTNLTSTKTESNGIDIHMEKNTEYGAIAILSASAYGNPNKVESGQTTTGNKSGIVMNLNKEMVSSGSLTSVTQYTNANGKYKNIYTSNYVAKLGDAITETSGWHGSGESTWLSTTGKYEVWSGSGPSVHPDAVCLLLRAYSGSIFSYYGYGFEGHWFNRT